MTDSHCGSSRINHDLPEIEHGEEKCAFLSLMLHQSNSPSLISSGSLVPCSYVTSKTAVGTYKLETPAIGSKPVALEISRPVNDSVSASARLYVKF